jgi:hypothetical protein
MTNIKVTSLFSRIICWFGRNSYGTIYSNIFRVRHSKSGGSFIYARQRYHRIRKLYAENYMIFDGHAKIPNIIKLDLPELINAALHLPSNGKLSVSRNNLVYLDTDDVYIHQLFPLLFSQRIIKPNYFGENSVGAHITVIYPEENKIIDNKDLNQEHSFIIKDVVTAEIDLKTYYVLLVESHSLLNLRRQYDLPDMLCFKNYSIGFHITMGVHL